MNTTLSSETLREKHARLLEEGFKWVDTYYECESIESDDHSYHSIFTDCCQEKKDELQEMDYEVRIESPAVNHDGSLTVNLNGKPVVDTVTVYRRKIKEN
jgi:hypothetical protein